ncbi:carbohydrate ABC transporter permease [Paenibacillus sp. HB172176]|uniref:carbohydrate ABC transporter permease n=1 Tax=Paenibacillus sp. HB172176 TaxID=2493690 RepID=UPI0014395E95|nr:carbohydrate ABC transporter permease [Paenibacillus sp. HB172176]
MNANRKGFGNRLFDTGNIIFLSFIALCTFYPLWHELCLSFSSVEGAYRGGLFFLPRGFNFQSYINVFQSSYIWQAYGNSIFVTVVGALTSVFFTALTAYPLARRHLPMKNGAIAFILFTMIFSGGLIPTYFVVKETGLINSLWALIIPDMLSAFNVIVAINFFRTIPEEIEESAMMDGASPIRTFLRIILPISKPIIATILLWEGVRIWNNFLHALIYLNHKSLFTLPLLLKQIIKGQDEAIQTGQATLANPEAVIAATIIVTLVPIIAAYPFLQRYFVKGVMLGSVKS